MTYRLFKRKLKPRDSIITTREERETTYRSPFHQEEATGAEGAEREREREAGGREQREREK